MRAKFYPTTVEIRNTLRERRLLDKMNEAFDFEEEELHLFCWYIGFRLCVDNFLGVASKPPNDEETHAFCERHKKPH